MKVVLDAKKVFSLIPPANFVEERGYLKLLRIMHLAP
jgi:hypothetical protein